MNDKIRALMDFLDASRSVYHAVSYIADILDREGLHPKTAVDLACGTGSVALLLAQAGTSTKQFAMKNIH